MRKKIKDINMPIGKMARVADFLPSPEELVIPQETVKITLSLNKSSIDFFKRKAGQYHTKYQKMIRRLLDKYVEQYA